MSTEPSRAQTDGLPGSAHENGEVLQLLRQVHDAVTANRRSGGLQVLTAIVLSLATLMSTWCGYQAARWSGVQSSMQSDSDTAEREAAENTLAGLQIRTQDAMVVLEYWRAMRGNDTVAQATILAHMRPELKRAVEASVREGIAENPSVAGPLQQEEYVLSVESLAGEQRQKARTHALSAIGAGRMSRDYVLISLMLASVLFVGGISNTFSRAPIRRTLGIIALCVFGVALLKMASLQVLWPVSGGQT